MKLDKVKKKKEEEEERERGLQSKEQQAGTIRRHNSTTLYRDFWLKKGNNIL